MSPETVAAPRRAWAWPVLSAAAAVCVVVTVVFVLEDQYGFRRAAARGDWERAELAARRLGWIGRGSAEYHLRIAGAKISGGDFDTAEAHLNTSFELNPTPNVWMLRGQMHRLDGDWSSAARAYEAAAELDPNLALAHYWEGVAWTELGELGRARTALKRALELAPGTRQFQEALSRVHSLQRESARDRSPALDQRS